MWVDPQVRPSSQRGASSALSSGWPKRDVAREDRRLGLRLAIAAHGAIGHDAAIFEHGERRIERVERPAAGRKRVERLRVERKTGAAVLHHDAGRRQHAAGAELPVKRLDVGDDEPARVRRAHPDRVAFALRRRPARGLACVDLGRFGVEESWRQILIEIGSDLVGIGDDTVAHAKGALGRFDNAVDVFEAFRLRDAQTIEQREDDSEASPCVGGGEL